MTREEWLQICRLNHEWYLRNIITDATTEWIKEHMPSDEVFDDGRIEFFQKNFTPELIDFKAKAREMPNDDTIKKITKLVWQWNHYMSQTFGDIDNKEDCLTYIKNHWND